MIQKSIIGSCLLLILGLLVACGGNTDVAPTATAPPSTPFVALTPTSNVPNSTAPLVTYQVTGGIAGVDEKMVIAQNGDITVTERGATIGSGHLTANQIQALQQQFDNANFFSLKDEYNQGAVADDRFMTVTYTQGERTKSVKVAEVGGQRITPAELSNLLAVLRQMELQAQGTAAAATPTEVMPGTTPSSGP